MLRALRGGILPCDLDLLQGAAQSLQATGSPWWRADL